MEVRIGKGTACDWKGLICCLSNLINTRSVLAKRVEMQPSVVAACCGFTRNGVASHGQCTDILMENPMRVVLVGSDKLEVVPQLFCYLGGGGWLLSQAANVRKSSSANFIFSPTATCHC